jgi:uncharacterized protein
MFFTRKKNRIEEQTNEYLEAAKKCKDAFLEGMEYFVEHGVVDKEYILFVQKVTKYEGIADDLRDSIARKMYEDSLIPESRGDVLAFLETFDRIPNRMEGIVQFIDEVNLAIPPALLDEDGEFFTREIRKLCMGVVTTFELAIDSGRCFFTEPQRVREYTVAIDRHESDCDKIESALKRYVFHQKDFSDLQKILFLDLLERVGDIADMAEDFQRRIILLSLKNLY